MTQDQFHIWLQDPTTMNAESIRSLREITERYPYFQSAQMLLTKNLKQENHIDQLNQLHLAAVCVPDRKVFYDYMHDRKKAETIAPVIEQITETEKSKTAPAQESAQKKPDRIFPDDLIAEPIVYQLETADLPEIEQSEIPLLRDPKPDEQQPEPTELSFSEWLAYTQKGKLEQQEKPTLKPKKVAKQKDNKDLIAQFLADHPAGKGKKRAEFFNPQKAAAKSMEEDFTVVSETLANIYAQQEKYELATQAYEALSLKYPEKSVYFAARLKEINEKVNSEK